jgi:hypothetical protein
LFSVINGLKTRARNGLVSVFGANRPRNEGKA